jgi:hypothetical protein
VRWRLVMVCGTALACVLALLALVVVRRSGDGPVLSAPAPVLQPVVVGDRVMRVIDPANGLSFGSDDERRCVINRLNWSTPLIEDLGDQPASSPRFAEVRAMADSCRFEFSSGPEVRAALTERGGVVVSDEQVGCLRSGLGSYPPADRDAVASSRVVGLRPGPLRDRLGELLSICGIDGSILEPS